MTLLANKGTLQHQLKSRPIARPLPVAHLPLGGFAQKVLDFRTTIQEETTLIMKPNPEKEAIRFYLYEHMLHSFEKTYRWEQDLPPEAAEMVNMVNEDLSFICRRALYYLLLITIREARHVYDKEEWKVKAKEVYGVTVGGVLSTMDSANIDVVTKGIMSSCPDIAIGPYTKWLVELFAEGNFSGGFGGLPWSDIARCLSQFVNGEVSMAVMTDISWSLAHNNGPIYNKGMLYGQYNTNALQEILDTQRAGCLPVYVRSAHKKDKYAGHDYIDTDMVDFCDKVGGLTSDSVWETSKVNWTEVKALGAIGNYTKYEKKKDKKKEPTLESLFVPDYPSTNTPIKSKPAAPVVSEKTHLIMLPSVGVESIPSPRAKTKKGK